MAQQITIKPSDHSFACNDDETVLAVPLPSPVPPHGEITLDIAFRAVLRRPLRQDGDRLEGAQ